MPTAMETLFVSFTAVVGAVVGTIGGIITQITTNPILLIPVGLGLLGVGVGLVKKFI